MKKITVSLFLFLLIFSFNAFAEEAVPEEFGTLKLNDQTKHVEMLQNRLISLGFLQEASKIYDEQTQEAVKKIQFLYGMEETGEADADLQELVYSENLYLPLEMGSTGDNVKKLQEKLKALSIYSGDVNGEYEQLTSQAVQIFQKLYGKEATGIADVSTLELLYSDLNEQTILPSPTPAPRPGTITVSKNQVVPFTKKLEYGTKSANVQKVQQRLMDLGFFTFHKTTTGYYRNTQAAVKAFQEHNGLLNTGSVDETTWNALFNSKEVVDAKATPRPSPEPTPAPYFVDVDVKNQVTKVFTHDEKGDYNQLVRVMICSTGTSSYPSDIGTWTLTGRRARWATFPTWGGGTAQYWVKINSSIAFHSTMYVDYDVNRPNEKSFKNLGRRASHGCIRLTTTDAKWMYENCREGTDVYIHNESNTDKEAVAFALYRKNNPSTMLPDISKYNFDAPPPEYRSLRGGAVGNDVMWLQMTLKHLGYFKEATVTGHFHSMTGSAVKAFQKAQGLKADGVVGQSTYNALYKEQLIKVAP